MRQGPMHHAENLQLFFGHLLVKYTPYKCNKTTRTAFTLVSPAVALPRCIGMRHTTYGMRFHTTLPATRTVLISRLYENPRLKTFQLSRAKGVTSPRSIPSPSKWHCENVTLPPLPRLKFVAAKTPRPAFLPEPFRCLRL